MKKVVVIGANGQLGKCLHDAAPNYPDCNLRFVSRDECNIEEEAEIRQLFDGDSYDYCVNVAAYTNVEKAESEPDRAFLINAEAVKNLAAVCKEGEVTLVHISTDYVFNGEKTNPYVEDDDTDPLNVYGASKLKGEDYLEQSGVDCFILRTSWLYSQYGHNFLNTVLRVASEGKALTITTEQTGTPTNANDLADAILRIIDSESKAYGLYHYSNDGSATWYDFARAILENTGQIETVSLAQTGHYRTFAERPKYSVLDKTKFTKTFNIETVDWETSLRKLIQRANN